MTDFCARKQRIEAKVKHHIMSYRDVAAVYFTVAHGDGYLLTNTHSSREPFCTSLAIRTSCTHGKRPEKQIRLRSMTAA